MLKSAVNLRAWHSTSSEMQVEVLMSGFPCRSQHGPSEAGPCHLALKQGAVTYLSSHSSFRLLLVRFLCERESTSSCSKRPCTIAEAERAAIAAVSTLAQPVWVTALLLTHLTSARNPVTLRTLARGVPSAERLANVLPSDDARITPS